MLCLINQRPPRASAPQAPRQASSVPQPPPPSPSLPPSQLQRTEAPLSIHPPHTLSIPPLEKARAYSSKSRPACSGTRPGPGPGRCQRWWNGLRLAGSFVHAPGQTRRGKERRGEATVEHEGQQEQQRQLPHPLRALKRT